MATTKTTKKNTLPKIAKKWYDFKIDPATLRPVRFSWHLSSGLKEVIHYNSLNKQRQDYLNCNLRNCISSYYFVLDKTNKRIFAYPIQLTGHQTRSSCETAHYEAINSNTFYMWDENKQLWEIPYREYRKYIRYDWHTRTQIYEDVKAEPRKVSRLSTYYYKVQAQLPSYIRSIFAELYGKDFVYQNKLITDSDIRNNHWYWTSWLNTKGRKYSDKTIKATDDLMSKFSSECRTHEEISSGYNTVVTLETINDVTAMCYFSQGKETFRQIFNPKTGKLDNFIWKNDKWQKSGKLSDWQQLNKFEIKESYQNTHEYDYKFLKEANFYYNKREGDRRYWYSPCKSLYDFTMSYISNPVIHQLLQIQNERNRNEIYQQGGKIHNLYGKMPNRGKTMFAKLGINKYQFENPQCIVHIKQLLNTNDISHIDQTTWNMCVNIIDMRQFDKYDTSIATFLRKQNKPLINTWCKLYSSYDKLSSEYQRRSSGRTPQGEIKELYRDYFQGLSSLQRRGLNIAKYPIVFNNAELLQRYHDEISISDDLSEYENHPGDQTILDLYHAKQHMLENDGTYCILHPQSAYDVGYEGAYLRHCVGRCYLNSIIQKTTSIYFLRRLEAPNTPWLTVEVRNKQCIQIHGYSNSWMGSSDKYFDAVPFLCWWFEKHDITCPPELLTCRSLSYSSYSSSYRAMPYEKIEAYKQSRKLKKYS